MPDRTTLPADEHGNLVRPAINDRGEMTRNADRANPEGSTFRDATDEEIEAVNRFPDGVDVEPKPEWHPHWID